MSAPALPKESALLATLTADNSLNEKAKACQLLAIVGSESAIPALIDLLGQKELSSHARIALEAIGSPAVSDALIATLPKLKGRQLAGAILSLGQLRSAKAIAPIGERIADPSDEVITEAIAALGMIATPEAVTLLKRLLKQSRDDLQLKAGHAALTAASHQLREQHSAEAKELLQATVEAIDDGPVNQAAKSMLAPLS